MIDIILSRAPIYLLIFARCFALILTLPLFSTRAVSRVAKIAFSGYMAYFLLGSADLSAYKSFLGTDGAFSLYFVMLLVGEAFIGIIIGFYITIIFSAFSTASMAAIDGMQIGPGGSPIYL